MIWRVYQTIIVVFFLFANIYWDWGVDFRRELTRD